MKLLIDTNVVLDVLLKRQPFCEMAADVLKLCERDDIQECVSASAVTDIYYIANKMMRNKLAVREMLNKLLQVVSIAAVSENEIVTRNPKDFAGNELSVWTPEELIRQMTAQE